MIFIMQKQIIQIQHKKHKTEMEKTKVKYS